MNQITFHYISDKYINYLRTADSRVRDNKIENRPYAALGITINDLEYYIPLSSPKFKYNDEGEPINLKKPRIYKNLYHIMERETEDNQIEYLGTLLFNNMIPAPLNEVDFIDISELFKTNPDYAILLTKQIDAIKNDIDNIQNKAESVYNSSKTIKHLERLNYIQTLIKKQCCDFQILEQAKLNFEKQN
jgi:hypothetical protein